MLRHTVYGHDVWQVDFCWSRRRQFNFCLFSSFFQTLHSHRIFCQIRTFVIFEFLYQPVNDYLVEIITTQVGITISRKYFKHTTTKFKDRDIECTTTKVEYSNLHIFVSLIKTISQSSSCRFVHNTFHFQTCNLTSFFSSLTLWVWEVCRNGDNSFCNFLSQIILGCFLHLLQDHSWNFLRSIKTSVNIYTRSIIVTFHYFIRNTSSFLLYLIPSFTHETLDRENSTLRISDCLTFCRITYFTFATVDKCNDRWSSTFTFTVCDYYRFVSFEYRNTRVCCS